MTVFMHEWKQSYKNVIIWSVSISLFIAAIVLLYPDMKGELGNLSTLFSNLGALSTALGLDTINFGTFIGYYAIECGNTLGIFAPIFAAIISSNVLSKEEKDKTSEFLFSHPITRKRIISEKLLFVLSQLFVLNIIVSVISMLSMVSIQEPFDWKELLLLHFGYFLVQIEIACICFAFSAFSRKSGAGISIGITIALYSMNLIANISESAKFLRYITPFAYTNSSELLSTKKLDVTLLCIGLLISTFAVIIAYLKYQRKDLAA